MKPLTFGLTLIASLAVGATLAGMYGAHEVQALKAHADSVAVAERARDSVATRWADSVRAVVAADTIQTKIRIKYVEVKSASEDSLRKALATAKTAADSLPNLVTQVAVLSSTVDTLKAQVRQDTLDLWKAMARGDSLQQVVFADGEAMAGLRKRIDALNAPKLPKFFRISLEVVKDAGLVWTGMQIGKAIAKK